MSDFIRLPSPTPGEAWVIPVLHDDEHVLALDKPPGLLTSPDSQDPQRPSLMRLLYAAIADGAPWARARGLGYVRNLHQLDLDTTGVLVLAKSKRVFATLADQFGSEKPVRTCLALVQGTPPERSFEVNAPLAPHPARPELIRVDLQRGKRASTRFEVVEPFLRHALVRCVPLTDRPHQIRAHLRHAGLPVVGAVGYGGKPLLLSRLKSGYRLKEGRTERPLISRAAIHAESVSVEHPVTSEALTITAPWPKDLTVAVRYLRRYARANLLPESGGESAESGV